eukprot:m.921278 g.921278  ORF g.921278 m.921278 type:complete len:78 (-) comp23757_c0_seq10:415-648(-)
MGGRQFKTTEFPLKVQWGQKVDESNAWVSSCRSPTCRRYRLLGAFLDACPNQHCQTSTGWRKVVVNGTQMADAVCNA